jgi:hypothetical protein
MTLQILLQALILMLGAALLQSCSETPATPKDPTMEAWYGESVEQLSAIMRDAESLFREGRADDAAAKIKEAEPVAKRVVSVPKPTLAAVLAASDVDDLYGRMLLTNRHYGWARIMFQKNAARWKYWQPRSPEVEDRLQRAQAAIAECDRHIVE